MLKKPASAGKPALWLKLMPKGCGKCRSSPGCTRSCWLGKSKKVRAKVPFLNGVGSGGVDRYNLPLYIIDLCIRV